MQYEKKLYNDRRPKGTVCNKAYSIYNQCRECNGWDGDMKKAVTECTASDCPLFLFRRPPAEIRSHMASNTPLYYFDEEGTPKYVPSNLMSHMGYQERSMKSYDRFLAIKTFCKECMCMTPREHNDPIRECTSEKCWLWPHRMGTVEVD